MVKGIEKGNYTIVGMEFTRVFREEHLIPAIESKKLGAIGVRNQMISNLVWTYQRGYFISNVIVVNLKIIAVGKISNTIVARCKR